MDQFEMISREDIEANRFTIDSDAKAEWAMRKVTERFTERDRLLQSCDEMIAFYEECKERECFKADRDTANLMFKLQEFFRGVESKATKTQATYKLPSGKLKLIFARPKITVSDDAAVMQQFPQFVENVPKLKWADVKKNLAIDDGGNVVDAGTGEIVEGCSVEVAPERFTLECDL